LFTSGLGNELNVQDPAFWVGPPQIVVGGSKAPGAYSTSPCSITRTVSVEDVSQRQDVV
jgi:hypothetical protein